MQISVIGTGYVGLVTGACFAEMGNNVFCVDIDAKKIEDLKVGVLPIYEPGLKEIVVSNFNAGRLSFTVSLEEAIQDSDIIFIAVGTPPGEDGSADLQYVLGVAGEIGRKLEKYAVVVDKSTVPIGTADKVESAIRNELNKRNCDVEFDVVSNPEFLKEGAAVSDFMSPDRIVIGSSSARAKALMEELYTPFNRNHPRTVHMAIRDAEMTKYAANAMLATKISFMNEIACVCERLGVDVENVRLGIGSDQRIGFHFIYPGPGYGGSCFPKDVKALINIAKDVDFDAKVLKAVEARNDKQKTQLFEKASKYFGGDLRDKTFAVWGLAFKPGTDDMREAPSVVLINALLMAGAKVRAFDPVAIESARREFGEHHINSGALQFPEGQYEALIDADALFLVTEWKPFRYPDLKAMLKLMKSGVIFDGRNQYDPEQMEAAGFQYSGIGRAGISSLG